MKKLIFALTCLFLAIPCHADVIIVGPGGYSTIQAGVNAAGVGDTVIVADGTYKGDGNRDIDFLGKAITLRSENSPESCIIDCEGTYSDNHRGFYFHSGEGPNSVLQGFTIRDGFVVDDNGGGIYLRSSSPTIENCIIANNSALSELVDGIPCYGGGIYSSGGYPTLIGCTFIKNRAFDRGGGIYKVGGRMTLTDCTFTDNFAANGGGMANWGPSAPVLINCTFSGNGAYHGGGIFNRDSDLRVINGNFSRNFAYVYGGGIRLIFSSNPTLTSCSFSGNIAEAGGAIEISYYSSATLFNCTVCGNIASYYGGGGVYSDESSLTVTNCIFVGNTSRDLGAGPGGGGAIFNSGIASLTNCIIFGNTAQKGGGGIRDYGEATLANCIFWGNTASTGPEIWGSVTVSYSNIKGLWPGEGNIDADPCFADPCNGDYHLKSQAGRWEPNSESWVTDAKNSPAVDAGDPNSDWTAELWPHGKRINMGAYGGTTEASMSQLDIGNIANLDNDVNDIVNSLDLALFVGKWCYEEFLLAEDLNRDGFVNFNDFAIFGQQWSEPSASEPGMTFQIDDCNMEEGQSWPVAAESNEPRFSVWVEGRYIYFEDQMYANCCPEELGLDKEINGNEITLYEIGYGGMCLCMCYFPVTATLGPFEDGTYTVEVYDNYGNSLGVVEVTIGGSPEPGITFRIDECDLFSQAEQSSQARFSVTVDGRYIHFEDLMYANCCPEELGLEMTVEDNLITIYETEYTPDGCRCWCNYPITATLGPFEPGVYTLDVYEDHSGFIGSTTVVIDPPE